MKQVSKLPFVVLFSIAFLCSVALTHSAGAQSEGSSTSQDSSSEKGGLVKGIQNIFDFAFPPTKKEKPSEKTEAEADVTGKKKPSEEKKKEPAKEDTFDPIIVSGTRLPSYEQRLSDIPGNVSVVTRTDIDQSGSQTPQQAMSELEGVNIYDQVGNVIDSEFNLRGFNTGEEVVTVVDGVRYNEPDTNSTRWQLINLDNVERIEVQRGSISPVYGDGAFGGVVNIRTRRASDKLVQPHAKYEFGSNSTQHFNGGVSGTIPDEWTGLDGGVTYYFNGARKVSDGWRWNSKYQITDFDIKTGYKFFDDSGQLTLGIKRTITNVGNPGELSWDEYTENRRMSVKTSDHRDYRHTVLFFDGEKRFFDDFLGLSWNLHHRDYDSGFVTTTRGRVTSGIYQSFRNTGFNGQINFNNEWKVFKNHLVGGLELDRYKEHDRNDRWIGQGFFAAGLQADAHVKKNVSAVYFDESLEFFERVVGTVGLRHDRIRFKYLDYLVPTRDTNAGFDETTAKTGVVIKPFKWWDIYGNFSEGFKSPGFSEYFNTLGFNPNNALILEPETSDSYEFGTRLRIKKRASIKFAWYHINLRNEILSDWVTGRNFNVGKSRRYGVELSGKAKILDNLSSFATYTYTDARLRSAFNQGWGSVYQSGRWINNTPKQRITFGATWEPIKDLKISFDGLYVGRRKPLGNENAAAALPIEKSYWVFNSRASYQFRNLNFFINWRNMLDAGYYTRAVDFGTNYIEPAPPSEVYAGVSWNFE